MFGLRYLAFAPLVVKCSLKTASLALRRKRRAARKLPSFSFRSLILNSEDSPLCARKLNSCRPRKGIVSIIGTVETGYKNIVGS